MKRVGYLYKEVMNVDNIKLACDVYNKNRPIRLRRDWTEEEAREILASMLSDFKRCIGSARKKRICDKGKWRDLEIPGSFKSSVAQLALWNICGKFVENRIHDMSFSSRVGKGGHLAAGKLNRFVQQHGGDVGKWCFYFDIKKYYAHVRKDLLMNDLERIFKDKRVLELFRVVIFSTEKGLPIGYPFSHALANLYITGLYNKVVQYKGVSKMFVYMDNCFVFSKHKTVLKKLRAEIVGWLQERGCGIKEDWQIFPVASRGVKICGLVVQYKKQPKLYKGIWRRTLRNFRRLINYFRKSDYLGMQSRLGWLDMCSKRHSKKFKFEGGYLWK